MQSNSLAAASAIVAAAMLAVAFWQPFLTMEKLGERRSFSLPGGVAEMYDRGYFVIGTVLLVFCVIFPVVKLLALLLATSRLVPLSLRARRVMHKAADLTGKYSLLDVLVVAVFIVLVRFQNLAHVEANAGTVWFCGAVLMSMFAGLCVRLPEKEAT